MAELNHPHAQSAKIKELLENEAVLALNDGQELRWPKHLLPNGAEKGASVRIIIHDKKTDQEERDRLARSLLNEIFGGKTENLKN